MTTPTTHIVRVQPRPPLEAFIAWGFVLAEGLPAQANLGHVRISRLSGQRLTDLRKTRPVLAHPSGPAWFASSIPADTVVRSDWSIWIRVDAETEDEALERIRSTYLPPALTALETFSRRPVVVELLRIGVEDARGFIAEPRSPYSLSGFFSSYAEPLVLNDADVQSANAITRAIEADSKLLSASQAYHEAHYLEITSGGLDVALAAALLRYFHVIEVVAVTVPASPGPDVDKRLEEVLTRLRKGLTAKGTFRNQAAKVRNSARDLDRLDQRYLTLRIEHAAEVLKLDGESIGASLALAKLRNTELSHPGTAPALLAGELAPARSAAGAFLLAAVRAAVHARNSR